MRSTNLTSSELEVEWATANAAVKLLSVVEFSSVVHGQLVATLRKKSLSYKFTTMHSTEPSTAGRSSRA